MKRAKGDTEHALALQRSSEGATARQLQGIWNNIRGVAAELDTGEMQT